MGRGVHFPIAVEAALKFKELTYIEAGAYPLGELKHGPMAVIDNETLCVVIMPRDHMYDENCNSVEQIKSKSGNVLIVTDISVIAENIIKKSDDAIFIQNINMTNMYPLLEIVPLQLLAYYFAKQLGRNIDKPRNLAKSVTVR